MDSFQSSRCALQMLRAVTAALGLAAFSGPVTADQRARVRDADVEIISEESAQPQSGAAMDTQLAPHSEEFGSNVTPDEITWQLEHYAAEGGPPPGSVECDSELQFDSSWLGLRHSSTHGRHAGLGHPLTGTSWLNRPYFVGGELGTLWITDSVQDDVTGDIDLFGGLFAGWDWDHYWGTELAVHRATPELRNENDRDSRRGDRLMIWSASMMYYPWGDAMFRPYWRSGIGATNIDFPIDNGERRDESLWTVPLGLGVKYPVRRWLAARAEVTDYLAIGNSGVSTLHDVSLTFGLEWRFGAHPRSYYPWNPSRHIR